jgi:hypothetical protein
VTFYTADCEPDPDPRDAQIAHLTEQVRVARAYLGQIAEGRDATASAIALIAISRMETADD